MRSYAIFVLCAVHLISAVALVAWLTSAHTDADREAARRALYLSLACVAVAGWLAPKEET